MRLIGTALLSLAVTLMVAGPAASESLPGETTFTDAAGNLVVLYASGAKRIVVGKGRTATQPAERQRVYLEQRQDGLYVRPAKKPCPYGALLKGRSYMYGLPHNVVPVPVARCN